MGFDAECEQAEVNPKKLEYFIAESVTLISGEIPVAGEKCNEHEHFDKRQYLES